MLIPLLAVGGLGFLVYNHFKAKAVIPPMKVDIKLPPVLGGQTVTVSRSPDSVINTLAQAAKIAANAEQIKNNIAQIQHTVADVQRVAPKIQAKQSQIQSVLESVTHVQNPTQAVAAAKEVVSTVSDIANMFGEKRVSEFGGKRYKVKA